MHLRSEQMDLCAYMPLPSLPARLLGRFDSLSIEFSHWVLLRLPSDMHANVTEASKR